TEVMAWEQGLSVDQDWYKELLKRHAEQSRGEKTGPIISAIQGELPKTDDSPKYAGLTGKAKLLGWVSDNHVIRQGKLGLDAEAALLLDRTVFYAEQGGQVGDTGTISTPTGRFEVEDTQKLGDSVLHIGKVVEGRLECGQPATLEV